MLSKQVSYDVALSSNRSLASNNVAFEHALSEIHRKSQPAYVAGKLIRRGVKSLAHRVKNAFQFLSGFFDNKTLPEPTFSELTSKPILDQEIVLTYQTLKIKMAEAANQAKKLNKPLLILVGEDHYSFSSAIIEVLLLKMSSSEFSIDTILTESFSFSSYAGSYGNYFVGTPLHLLEMEIERMGLQKISIDLANCDAHLIGVGQDDGACFEKHKYLQIDGSDSEFNLKVRNAVMSQIIVEKARKNTLAVVGAAHLYGMAEETDLKDHFHLLLIDAAGLEKYYSQSRDIYEKKCIEYVSKNNIYTPILQSLKNHHYPFSKREKIVKQLDSLTQENLENTPRLPS